VLRSNSPIAHAQDNGGLNAIIAAILAEPPSGRNMTAAMVLLVDGLEVEVKTCTSADVPVLLSFFRSMAAFERLPITATEESLRTALFSGEPAAHALIVSVGDKPIGYVVYYFTFSTLVGKRCLWLEDLFIDPAFRGKGIGRVLMAYLAGIAIQHQCGRFEWSVLDWNEPALRFYKSLGASVLDDWRICRLTEAQLDRVARPR
jgi:GNAT superfamily N-acetyltransferase